MEEKVEKVTEEVTKVDVSKPKQETQDAIIKVDLYSFLDLNFPLIIVVWLDELVKGPCLIIKSLKFKLFSWTLSLDSTVNLM